MNRGPKSRSALPPPNACLTAGAVRALVVVDQWTRIRVTGRRIAGTDVYRLTTDLGRRTGVRARPHAVRHSAITSVLEASGDRRLRQTFARHRDGRVTERYDDARANLAGKARRLAASLL